MKRNIKIFIVVLMGVLILFGSEIRNIVTAGTNIIPQSYIQSPLVKLDSVSKNKKYQNKFIIKLKSDLSETEKSNYMKDHSLTFEKVGENNYQTNTIVTSDLNGKIDNRYIDSIEQDASLETQTVKLTDPQYTNQWYLPAINYDSMLENPTKKHVTVAVIDSGICSNHEDLKGKILPGWNFINNNLDTTDTLGHGCEVSGLIASNVNNNIGIAGASLNTKIIPLKVIDTDGSGSYSNLINAINYATLNKVDIINISLGGYFDSKILHEAIQNALNNNITIVASAGNTGNNQIMFPAIYKGVVSVGSVENDYTISPFSNDSTDVKIWAFGSNILSTNKDGGYKAVSGTSISSALVTAFLAEGGKYDNGGIINYLTTEKKPVFSNISQEVKEPITGISVKVPQGLKTYSFSHPDVNSDTLINWEETVYTSQTEAFVISIWNRESKKVLEKVFKEIKLEDKCSDSSDICLTGYPQIPGNYISFYAYITKGNSLIRINYNISRGVGINVFKNVISSVKIKDTPIDYAKYIKFIESKVKLDNKIYTQGADTCGGFTDPGNPFNCCSNARDSTENNANCTWYAAYKRHDLWGIETKNAGSWYDDAKKYNSSLVSQTPSPGALVDWSGHVAYIESTDIPHNKITWSEQNCYNTFTNSKGQVFPVNAYNSSVTHSYPNEYGGSFNGYIVKLNNCNGNNQTMSDWKVNGPLNCNPSGIFKIQPNSILNSTNGNINIKAN